MRIVGISAMRNEVDVVAVAIGHHLRAGCDAILVVDNGSSDGTTEVLAGLAAADPRVRWTRDDGPFQQAEIMTGLAREAAASGADWIVPFDADELWWSRGGDLAEVLRASGAGVLRAPVTNFVQHRRQQVSSPTALLGMTMRAQPVGAVEEAQELVSEGRIAFVQMRYPPKAIVRAGADVVLETGNHSATGADGEVEATDALECLHAPLRSFEGLTRKVVAGRRMAEAFPPWAGWHARRWAVMDDDALALEWAANSQDHGVLDLAGGPQALVADDRLRHLAAPLVTSDSWRGRVRRASTEAADRLRARHRGR